MAYAILRFQKKKSGGVTVCYAHNERKKEAYKSNPDIVVEHKSDNFHLILPKQTYWREVQRLITAAACRTRKDSTVMVETLITASPEFMNALPPKEQREFFERALTFMRSKIGEENIIAAVVHMDEKTPHMHLSFCPITDGKNGGKSLSAKTILGNQAQLSKWQTEYHAAMSARWPSLERGISTLETGRKHIPLSLFKQAERLDKQIEAIEAAINDIGVFGNAKKREAAVKLLHEWFPRAQYFTSQVKKVDDHIAELERKEAETRERIRQAEKEAARSADRAISQAQAQAQAKLADLSRILREERERSEQLRRQCRSQEILINQIPLEQRDKLKNQTNKIVAAQEKAERERGYTR